MKVKYRLALIGILPSILAVMVGTVLALSARRIQRLERAHVLASDTAQGVYALSLRTADYLIRPEQGARNEWLAHVAGIRNLLDRAEQAAVPEDLRHELLALRTHTAGILSLFGEFSAIAETQGRIRIDDPYPTRHDRLANELVTRVRLTAETAHSLQAGIHAAVYASQDQAHALVMALLLTMSFAVAAITFLTGHRIARSIRILHHGADVIGMGNLDHKIELGSGDEIGALARAFTTMAARLNKSHKELEDAVLRLEALDRARSDFISNVSHELRTPLTSMGYEIGNLLDGVVEPLRPRVRAYLVMLNDDCRRLSATVEDILDLSRIEAHTMHLNHVRIPLARLVRRAAAALRVQADSRGLELDVSHALPAAFVDGDPAKLERVLFNLVGNALKFTPEGGRIELSLHADPGTPGFVLVNVTDSGPGIPPEHIGKVTQKFYRVGEHVAGTGLGLPIAKEIVERHGGTLSLASPPPGRTRGTTATVRLPIVEAPLIFIAESDYTVRRAVESQMLLHGYRVMADTMSPGIADAIRRHRPDMVIVTITDPGGAGEELILAMKADPSLRRTPVFAVADGPIAPGRKGIFDGFGIASFPRLWWIAGTVIDRIENLFIGAAPAGPRSPEGRQTET